MNPTKPATPLPWVFDAERDNSASKQQMQDEPIGGSIMHDGFYIARIWSDCDSPVENGAYIVHACNNYPRLVEALREASVSINSKVVGYERERMDRWIALLRELGELS